MICIYQSIYLFYHLSLSAFDSPILLRNLYYFPYNFLDSDSADLLDKDFVDKDFAADRDYYKDFVVDKDFAVDKGFVVDMDFAVDKGFAVGRGSVGHRGWTVACRDWIAAYRAVGCEIAAYRGCFVVDRDFVHILRHTCWGCSWAVELWVSS